MTVLVFRLNGERVGDDLVVRMSDTGEEIARVPFEKIKSAAVRVIGPEPEPWWRDAYVGELIRHADDDRVYRVTRVWTGTPDAGGAELELVE